MRMNLKEFGLRFKFILIFSLLIILTSVLLSGFLIRKQSALIKNELEEKGEYLVRNLASSSEYGVLVEDTIVLSKLLKGVFADKDIAYLLIHDKEGHILSCWDKKILSILSSEQNENLTKSALGREGLYKQSYVFSKRGEEFFDFSFPVTTLRSIKSKEMMSLGLRVKGEHSREMVEKIGTVRVGITTAEMVKEIGEMKRLVFLVSGLIIGFGIFLVSIAVRIIIKPLERLAQATSKVATGDFSSEVEVKQKDEIGELANSFNLMTRNLKRLVGEIEEYNQDLEKKVEERTKKLEEAQAILVQTEKLSAIGQLISGVAHELNNPLASVLGFSQLALGTEPNSKTANYLKKICSEADRCSKIVNNLLTFSRKSRSEKHPVGINGIIERSLDLMSYQFKVNNIQVVKDLDPELPKTLGDFHQLQQVFLNIVTNAFQAMQGESREGKFEVRTRRLEDTIMIEFTDTGPGIPKENINKIFDPFFTTKEIGKGTGLGLSISYGIVKDHGGKIYALSEFGKGATFVIELPIVKATLPIEVKENLLYEVIEKIEADILVIDDEASILDLLFTFLKEKGYRVDTANSGVEALRKLNKKTYDLIICDLKMPNLSGQQFYSELIRTCPELSSRVVFCTGEPLNSQTEAFLKKSGCKVISKPFNLKELLFIIQDFLTPLVKENAN